MEQPALASQEVPDDVQSMLDRLSQSDAHFKHQQRGDPDLTVEEKFSIAQNLLNESHVKFLARFHKYLSLGDISCFEEGADTYEISFYIGEIKAQCDRAKSVVKVRNRRYQAMNKLMSEGYFSEEEMEKRNPHLYNQYIGQYLTDAEQEVKRKQSVNRSDLRLSNIILDHMDHEKMKAKTQEAERLEQPGSVLLPSTSAVTTSQVPQRQNQQNDLSSDESELESEDDETPQPVVHVVKKKKTNHNDELISDGEKAQLKQEFLECMQQQFLRGDDEDFDYVEVDNNEGYDNSDIFQRDVEEKYFDNVTDSDETDSKV